MLQKTSLRSHVCRLLLGSGATLLALTLAGCASGPKIVDESADFAPVDYARTCVLENPEVKSDGFKRALEAGLGAAGVSFERLAPGTGPDACPFVLTYSVETRGDVVEGVVFQTFEHGIPRLEAKGRAEAGKGLTAQRVAAFTEELMGKLRMIAKLKAREAEGAGRTAQTSPTNEANAEADAASMPAFQKQPDWR